MFERLAVHDGRHSVAGAGARVRAGSDKERPGPLNAAPVVAPEGDRPETGLEDTGAPSPGSMSGVESGPPARIDVVGLARAAAATAAA